MLGRNWAGKRTVTRCCIVFSFFLIQISNTRFHEMVSFFRFFFVLHFFFMIKNCSLERSRCIGRTNGFCPAWIRANSRCNGGHSSRVACQSTGTGLAVARHDTRSYIYFSGPSHVRVSPYLSPVWNARLALELHPSSAHRNRIRETDGNYYRLSIKKSGRPLCSDYLFRNTRTDVLTDRSTVVNFSRATYLRIFRLAGP